LKFAKANYWSFKSIMVVPANLAKNLTSFSLFSRRFSVEIKVRTLAVA